MIGVFRASPRGLNHDPNVELYNGPVYVAESDKSCIDRFARYIADVTAIHLVIPSLRNVYSVLPVSQEACFDICWSFSL